MITTIQIIIDYLKIITIGFHHHHHHHHYYLINFIINFQYFTIIHFIIHFTIIIHFTMNLINRLYQILL